MRDYPQMMAPAGHVEPAPRRVRAVLAGTTVFDTSRARYVWEWLNYPQYDIPLSDIDPTVLVDEHDAQRGRRGTAHRQALTVGSISRVVGVELDRVVLAETAAPVLVLENGLPRHDVPCRHLHCEQVARTDTVTECPCKGTTSAYSSGRVGEVQPDLAWSSDFSTGQLLPIAGMVAFANEMVDHVVGGAQLEHRRTHFLR